MHVNFINIVKVFCKLLPILMIGCSGEDWGKAGYNTSISLSFTNNSNVIYENLLGGSQNIEISMSQILDEDVALTVSVVGGTATDTEDFSLVSSNITITAGQTTSNVVIDVVGDNIWEGDETIILQISAASSVVSYSSVEIHTLTLAQIPQISSGRSVLLATGGFVDISCFLKTDQSLKCWGGTEAAVEVTGLSDPVMVNVAGDLYFYVTDFDGTVKRVNFDNLVSLDDFTVTALGVSGVSSYIGSHACLYGWGNCANFWNSSSAIKSSDGSIVHNNGNNVLMADGATTLTGAKYYDTVAFDNTANFDGYGWIVMDDGTVRWTDFGDTQGNGAYATYAIGGINSAKKVALTGDYGCVLLADGSLMCGTNASVGLTQKNDLSGSVIDIAAFQLDEISFLWEGNVIDNTGRMCALISDGSVECWVFYNTTPVNISGLINIISLSSGANNNRMLAVDSNKAVFWWSKASNAATEKTGL